MKSILNLFLFIVTLNCSAQINGDFTNKNVAVKVKNWNKKIFLFPEEYWRYDSTEIVKQIGPVEFEKVKIFSDRRYLPKEMSLFNSSNGKLADTTVLYKKLNELKLFKIATYTHFSKGVDRGLWVILRVPFNENKRWDSNVKWDSLYFILPKEYIEEIN